MTLAARTAPTFNGCEHMLILAAFIFNNSGIRQIRRCFMLMQYKHVNRSISLQLEYPVSETDDPNAERKSMNKNIFFSPK